MDYHSVPFIIYCLCVSNRCIAASKISGFLRYGGVVSPVFLGTGPSPPPDGRTVTAKGDLHDRLDIVDGSELHGTADNPFSTD